MQNFCSECIPGVNIKEAIKVEVGGSESVSGEVVTVRGVVQIM